MFHLMALSHGHVIFIPIKSILSIMRQIFGYSCAIEASLTFQLQKFVTNSTKGTKNMKQLGLDANSIFLPMKI